MKTTLLTLNQKLQGWEKLLIVMERGLQTASQLPARSDATLPIQSEKAKNEKKAGLASAANLGQQKKWAEVQIKNIVNESAGLGGFPSAEEFKKLAEANDLEKMARRIKQAKEIGPSSLEEEKRIRMYELKIYSAEPERPGFWGWLNNLFGGR
ncbi:MAG: hypothetical protein NT121_00225 [Chloroflexi bacterium]|nr:hypothetical protein [Chloroflexota bacterium]